MSDGKYLVKRGETYYYKRKYPGWMQEVFGTHYQKSLRTKDLREARRLRDMMHSEFYKVVDAAKEEGADAPMVIRIAKDVHRLKGSEPGTPDGDNEEGAWYVLEQHIKKIEDKQPDLAKQALRIAKARIDSKPLRTHLAEYERYCSAGLQNGSVRDRMKMVDKWADEIGRDVPVVSSLDPEDAWKFVNKHIIHSSVSQKTKNRRLNTLKLFYDWLQSKRYVKNNPFSDIKLEVIKGRRAGDKAPARQAWTDEQLKTILTEFSRLSTSAPMQRTRFNARITIPIIKIGMYTGMRLDEICNLQVMDCADDVLNIRAGKTASAVRQVPIHPDLKNLIDELKANRTSGPLIEGLAPGGPDRRAGWNISKFFGRRKRILGFPPTLVFHSLRHTFMTKLEQAEVNLLLIERIVGHKPNALAFSTYSKGATLDAMKEAISKISYDI
ncbi:MAG: tyrosine-type recombinase/integrase [Candidatus Thiodiazotropha endolucinida]